MCLEKTKPLSFREGPGLESLPGPLLAGVLERVLGSLASILRMEKCGHRPLARCLAHSGAPPSSLPEWQPVVETYSDAVGT